MWGLLAHKSALRESNAGQMMSGGNSKKILLCVCAISHLGLRAVVGAMAFPVTYRFLANGFALGLFKVHKTSH